MNWRVVCIWMQLLENNNNNQSIGWKQPLYLTTNKCHNGNVTHQSIKCYHKHHNRNEQHLQNQEQEDCFQYTQVTTSAHNKQQQTSMQAMKLLKWYQKISLPRTNVKHNERRNSNDIYKIKNKTVFTTHNRPQHATTNNQQAQWHQKIALPRTNTRHHNDNHIYDFMKKYIVSRILRL
mgnify:CR=1 FL=1